MSTPTQSSAEDRRQAVRDTQRQIQTAIERYKADTAIRIGTMSRQVDALANDLRREIRRERARAEHYRAELLLNLDATTVNLLDEQLDIRWAKGSAGGAR